MSSKPTAKATDRDRDRVVKDKDQDRDKDKDKDSKATTTYNCRVCQRSFKRPDHLARHERAHSNTRPFRCSLCSRTFGRRDIMLRHANHVHGITTQSDEAQVKDPRSPSVGSQSSTSTNESLPAQAADQEPANAAVAWAEEPIEPTTNADKARAAIASLGESALDDFISVLPTISSYAGLAQIVQYGLPIKTRTLPSAINWPVVNDPGLPEILRQGLGHPATRLSMGNLSSTMNGGSGIPSFQQQQPMPSPPVSLPEPTPCSLLTKSTFDHLVQSYKDHFTSLHPVFHFPTLDFSFESFSQPRPEWKCTPNSCCQWKRRPNRTLVISILALGAVTDHKRDLALSLYTQTRKEILSWLAKIRRVDSGESLPLDLFQAFINYISMGLSFGDKMMEQLTVGHCTSLKALVSLAGFEKPTVVPPMRLHLICPSCQAKAPLDWLAWIAAEERKRTFFSYFSLMSAALTYLPIPTMDWREVQHVLPCSDELWLQDDPTTWRSMFEKEAPQPLFRTVVQSLFPTRVEGQEAPNPSFIESSIGQAPHDRSQQPVDRFSCFLLITAIHRETFFQRMQNKIDVDGLQAALLKWQTLWPNFPTQEDGVATNTLFSCSIAMFDNTQLLLHVDVGEAREALVSRDYGKFCVTFSNLDLRLDSDGTGCSLSSGRDNWQQTFEIFLDTTRRATFRHISRYAVNALEVAFRCNPRPNLANPGLNMSLHTGIAIFYCIHLVSSWMCFFANCLNRRLYTTRLDTASSREDLEDVELLQDILTFARNRKAQFKAQFSVPQSPASLNERNTGRLARDLLSLTSHVFKQCLAIPAFAHLSEGLKVRSTIISNWVKSEMMRNEG